MNIISPESLERRLLHKQSLVEFSDLPVSENYINTLSFMADSVYGVSRWLNTALISALDERPDNFERTRKSWLELLGYDYLQSLALSGKGVSIAIFDGGFPEVDSHEGFKHLKEKGLIVETKNFHNNSKDVYKNNSHGTSVLSCITGIYNNKPVGLASNSKILLARTELGTEPWKEQLYWIQAAEWADKKGAKIIYSSLGYTSEHYFPEEMDGSSPVAEAATIASEKGILIINSIGNEGDNDWKILGTPADSKEVLSVGSIDPHTGIKFTFSSFGPNQNGDIKPNVMASGKVFEIELILIDKTETIRLRPGEYYSQISLKQ